MKIPTDIQTVLPAHTQENPFLIESYPYGRLRCQKRVWLETKKGKGTRCMGQTQNPKNGVWNKPHASTYAEFSGAMYLDSAGHVQWFGLNQYASAEECKNFLDTFGENCTNREEVEKWTKKKLLFQLELEKAGNPKYGSEEYIKVFLSVKKMFAEQGL